MCTTGQCESPGERDMEAKVRRGRYSIVRLRSAVHDRLHAESEIMEYHQRGGERARLAAGQGRLGFLRTWDVLSRVLPDAPTALLDIAGATDAYAGTLTQVSYHVQVVEPVPEHVAEAAAPPGVTAILGNARALPAVVSSVDAVLLLGPLYHLPEHADRLAVWREAARVVRVGGMVVATTISRCASLFDAFVKDYFTDVHSAKRRQLAMVAIDKEYDSKGRMARRHLHEKDTSQVLVSGHTLDVGHPGHGFGRNTLIQHLPARNSPMCGLQSASSTTVTREGGPAGEGHRHWVGTPGRTPRRRDGRHRA
ncbi:Methyltransferase type 11 [Salinispora tropica CNB-440]|uniref:Methyltransferase type 11 n=2 Tax=Salinispora tropica TaxID=168695 RepID=A4X521_SALTO|nr:Methyltransferase type 11 [Salinispora tropica CNB-440]